MLDKTRLAVYTSLILTAGMSGMTSSAHAGVGNYLSDGSGNVVRDGSGRCITVVRGRDYPECRPAVVAAPIVKPKPIVVAVIKPIPVVVVKPMPKPKPKPKPIVRVLTLNESAGSNFAFDSATLKPSAQNRLNRFTNEVMASNVAPSRITVTGHTDSIGSETYNQKLSVQRAQSVASYLGSKGFDVSKMSIGGKGELQPVASNSTKSGRAQNRRVEVKVTGAKRIVVRR